MKRRDTIDQLCEEWAQTRRQLLGLRDPVRASEYLGAVRSTLSGVRDHRGGDTGGGRQHQHFPEVYVGDAAMVNAVFKRMRPPLKHIMDVHYVVEMPRNKSIRAQMVGLSRSQYFDLVGRARSQIEGACAIVETVRTVSIQK